MRAGNGHESSKDPLVWCAKLITYQSPDSPRASFFLPSFLPTGLMLLPSAVRDYTVYIGTMQTVGNIYWLYALYGPTYHIKLETIQNVRNINRVALSIADPGR